MHRGFIKLHRKTKDWQWRSDPNVLALFINLLLEANIKENTWQQTKIEPGQVVIGLYSLAERTGLSVQQVRTALNKLKSTNEITIKSTNKFSIITIANWKSYNEELSIVNKPITNEQQTNNKQITTLKESKNLRTKRIGVKKPDDVSQRVWDSHLEIRKQKKQPLTEIALEGMIEEAAKAGLTLEQALTESCRRGWGSFKADWIKDKKPELSLIKTVGLTNNKPCGTDPELWNFGERK